MGNPWHAMTLPTAQVFEELYSSAVAADIQNLSCPTKIIGADPTIPFSFLPSVDLNDMVALDYDFVPGMTRFLQLEQPQESHRPDARFS